MAGKDEEFFDYKSVDFDERLVTATISLWNCTVTAELCYSYDDKTEMDRDAEEAYFAEE